MNKEILLVAETVSNEKGVSRDVIFEAIELALEQHERDDRFRLKRVRSQREAAAADVR